jgi:UDP-hydrolysing UDP-N-acetyl-D-glucosamine 2-epimerase
MSMRRMCVVTTSRSDYGLLRWLMRAIREDGELQLQVIATGMHLCPEFGLTYRNIEQDGFSIDCRVEMLLSADSESAVTKSIGIGLIAFADALEDLRPDVLVILGDRFELLSAAIAALIAKIPIAHIHGGETSEGAVDEGVRHAITKMASVHFAATEAYRRRIIQMGEDPDFVFAYGAPGLDALQQMTLLTKPELESHLDFSLESPTAILTYHPVTLETDTAAEQIENLLAALLQEGVRAVITKANADAQGRLISRRFEEFCATRPADYRFFDSLGQKVYLSCLRHLDLMVGNSSSGLIEAPSFGLPVVNIGDRQRGRIKAANVIDVGYSVPDIVAGVRQASSKAWRETLSDLKNPYAGEGDGLVSFRIKERLKRVGPVGALLKKEFHDFPWTP